MKRFISLEERYDRAVGIYVGWLSERVRLEKGPDCWHSWQPAIVRRSTPHFAGREVVIVELAAGCDTSERAPVFGWSDRHGHVRELWMQRARYQPSTRTYDMLRSPLELLQRPPESVVSDGVLNPTRAAVRAWVLESLRAAYVARRVGASSPALRPEGP